MKTLKMAKRFMAVVLVLALTLVTPVTAFATTIDEEIEFTKVEDGFKAEKVFDTEKLSASDKIHDYDPSDEVVLIVELESEPTLSGSASAFGWGGVASAEDLLAEQQEVIDQIDDAKVIYQYTAVMNGFAIECEYANIEDIKNIPGVKRVFVSREYQRIEPTMETAGDMTEVYGAVAAGYTGAGTTVAILDTGLETTHEAFQTTPADAKHSESDIADLLAAENFKAEAAVSGLSAADVYKNGKVAFAFDYADGDANVEPDADPSELEHGTHVAGIAAGYIATEEGEIKFSGVAPDAQLLIMKVFSDKGGGAFDSTIIAALEDAVYLGADVINMSLGSAAGFSVESYEATAEMYDRVQAAGINLMVAAGNDANATVGATNNTGYFPTANPDTGIVGSPSTYHAAVSVASINNLQMYAEVLEAGGKDIGYLPSSDTSHVLSDLIPEGEDSATLEYVVIPGLGTPEDFEGVDVEGKIALIIRGEISFVEKAMNAEAAGAVAAIIYNNTTGTISMDFTDSECTIPAVSITKADGEFLVGLETKEITVNKGGKFFENPEAWAMSSFSSIGVSNDLTLKPEITAPGGNIYSALPGNTYGDMSGTSMATPHMAGAAAIVREYVKEKYPMATDVAVGELVNQLLMSTSTPVYDEYGVFYTPRKQGSGIANVAAAVTTESYLSVDNTEVDGTYRPKINLGDDAAKTGVYELTFTIYNTSTEDKTYGIDVVTLAPYPSDLGDGAFEVLGYDTIMTEWDDPIPATQDINEATIPAGEDLEVTVTVTLTDEAKEYIDYYFENGTYVEGFVFVTDLTDTDAPELSLPFLGFYGDWNQAPVLDSAAIWEEDKIPLIGYHMVLSDVYGESYYYLGMDHVTGEFTDNIVISPNGDTIYDGITAVANALLRSADLVTYTVTDAEGNVLETFESENNFKTYYSNGMVYSGIYDGYRFEYYGTDAEGNVLPSGTQVTVTVTTDLLKDDGKVNESWSFPVTIDTENPYLTGLQYAMQDGRIYLIGSVADDVGLMGVSAYPYADYGYNQYSYVNYDVYADAVISGESDTFALDVTDLLIYAAENDRFNGLQIEIYDTVYNGVAYIVDAVDVDNSLHIVERSALLNVGEQAELYALENGDYADIVWASENEEVATVDENGIVTAVAPGTAVITATNAEGVFDRCIVGVRETTAYEYFGISTHHYVDVYVNESTEGLTELFLGEFEYYGVKAEHVEWKSMDESIVTYDEENGLVGVSEGFTMVVASIAMRTASGSVMICDAYVGVRVHADRTGLGALIDDCYEDIDPDDYPGNAYKDEYLDALEEAIRVYNDPEATAEDILVAYWRLRHAKQVLENLFHTDEDHDGEVDNVIINGRPDDAEEENPNTGAAAPSAIAAIAVLGAAAYVLGKKR